MTKTNMTNSEENGQQDLQKESFNMMQDITCRHEYDNERHSHI